MTDRSSEIAATLAKLATLLTEQQQAQPVSEPPETNVRTMPDRVLLTVEEAAQQLGIGRTKTYALVRSGELESVQIGRLRRVPKTAIDDYAAQLINQRSTHQHAA